jgi:ankyrin repeat protein
VLQVQLVLNQVTRSGIRKALREMSTELDRIFDDTLSRINAQNLELQHIAMSTLMWLSCARRPLLTSELQHAVSTRIGEPQIDPEEDCPPLNIIVESCSGLLTVEDDQSTIRLCHFSLQEYLESKRESLFSHAQTTITKICLTYLSYQLPEAVLDSLGTQVGDAAMEGVLKHLPFLRYVSEHWGYHAKMTPYDAVKDLALAFTKDPSKTTLAANISAYCACHSRESYLSLVKWPRVSQDFRQDYVEGYFGNSTTGLHAAATFDLTELLMDLLRLGLKKDAVDPFDKNNTALHIAAFRGHLPSVNALLQNDADPNMTNANYDTPLFLAVSGGHADVSRALIRHKAYVNMHCYDNWTALHKAVDTGQEDLSRSLISQGASVDAETLKGMCPLHRAAGRGHCNIIEMLLDCGAFVDAVTVDLWTALHGASRSGQIQVVELLLKHDANPNARTIENKTPLHYACRGGHIDVVRLLLTCGADLSAKDGAGQLPIHQAAKGNHYHVIGHILETESSQIFALNRIGASPLDVASSVGAFETVQFLRQMLGTLKGEFNEPKTDLERAIEDGDSQIVNNLIDHGTNINLVGQLDWTPLQLALQTDRTEIAISLLYAEADVNARGAQGWKALHVAARRGNARAVSICLKYGADINDVTDLEQTALHLACYNGSEETAKILIHAGADIEACDHRRSRPLHIVAAEGHEGIVRALLGAGANLGAKSGAYSSVQACAAWGCHYALVEFIRERRGF